MIEFIFGSAFSGLSAFISGLMTKLTFLAICTAGLIICLFSLIFGGDDGDTDTDSDTDTGDGHDGPSIVSVRGFSLLAVGFGAVG